MKDMPFEMFNNIFSRQKKRPATQQSTKLVSADTARAPDDVRLISIGDIHGRKDCLVHLLEKLDTSKKSRSSNWHFIFLGDYIDRGPDSRGVIDILIEFNKTHSVTYLLGNHERSMLSFIASPIQAGNWLKFGGRETLLSYGITLPKGNYGAVDLKKMGEDLISVLPASHYDFLNQLELSYTSGDYLFTHAGIDPNKSIRDQSETELLWIREPFLSCTHLLSKVVVHGHTVTESFQPEIRQHRIGIDTGAYICGKLTAAVFVEKHINFISNKD